MNESIPRPGTAQGGVRISENDPTSNVVALVNAAIQRQDDLREMQTRHLMDIGDLRSQHAMDLRIAEAKRIDAIRDTDVGAVNRATEVASVTAATLADQVAVSAETLRNQVSAAADAQAIALTAALEPIQLAIADLRRAQYEAQGIRTQVSEHVDDTRSSLALATAFAGVVIALIAVILSVVLG